MTEIGARTFYHGTKAELKPRDMLQGGHSSNYTERRSLWIYFSETVFLRWITRKFQTLLYVRLRRLLPLAIAHALMDGASVLVGVLLQLLMA